MNAMDKIILEETTNIYWGKINIYKEHRKPYCKEYTKELIAKGYDYYDVDKDFIYLYATAGGHDSRCRGELCQKISITNCEFIKIQITKP